MLIGKGGMYGNVLRISPPMNIGRAMWTSSSELLDRSLAVVWDGRRREVQVNAPVQPVARTCEQFPDLHPPLDAQSALAEANRCLFCFDAPCTAACPTHIDVPRFIKKIASGNLRGSALTILDANILGLSCARVCPVDVLCEGACVMHRYNAEAHRDRPPAALRHGPFLRERRAPGSAAVADRRAPGGWPASAAARHRWPARPKLRRRGHRVTIFDNRPLPGGLNTYGVAEYKLRAADSLREVELVRSHGRGVPARGGGRRAVASNELEEQVRLRLPRRGSGRHGYARHSGRRPARRDRRAALHRALQDGAGFRAWAAAWW